MSNRFFRLLTILVGTLSVLSSSFGEDQTTFDSYWHNGEAELNGYRISVSRYGQARTGTAVLIYVTEPFSKTNRVKLNDPKANSSDAVDVLKLNAIRDFQTGIYDYNTMVSTFVKSDTFEPMKISFTSAEWCGHVYEELLFRKHDVSDKYFSYFEGESTTRTFGRQNEGIAEDALWILLRGLRGDFLKPGETKELPILSSVYSSRLIHKPISWANVTIEQLQFPITLETPVGTFNTIVYSIKMEDRSEGKFYIEDSYPHRVLRWELLPDIVAELTGTARLKYWQLHDNGHESYLQQLGLASPLQ